MFGGNNPYSSTPQVNNTLAPNQSKENPPVTINKVFLTGLSTDPEKDKVEKLLHTKNIKFESKGLDGGIRFGKYQVGRRQKARKIFFMASKTTLTEPGPGTLHLYYISYFHEVLPLLMKAVNSPGKPVQEEEVFATFDEFFIRLQQLVQ